MIDPSSGEAIVTGLVILSLVPIPIIIIIIAILWILKR